MGGPLPDPTIVAVPAANIGGKWVSQTMAIVEAVAETRGYNPPAHAHTKALQCMLNVYDVMGEALEKRMSTLKGRKEATAWLDGRGAQFFKAVEVS